MKSQVTIEANRTSPSKASKNMNRTQQSQQRANECELSKHGGKQPTTRLSAVSRAFFQRRVAYILGCGAAWEIELKDKEKFDTEVTKVKQVND